LTPSLDCIGPIGASWGLVAADPLRKSRSKLCVDEWTPCPLHTRTLWTPGFHGLRVDLVSIYIDQAPTKRNDGDPSSNDIGLGLAAEHGVEVYWTCTPHHVLGVGPRHPPAQ
jgi:hypothetical protein